MVNGTEAESGVRNADFTWSSAVGKSQPHRTFLWASCISSDLDCEGLWVLSVFQLRQSVECLRWGGFGYVLGCGKESLLWPTSSWVLSTSKAFRRIFLSVFLFPGGESIWKQCIFYLCSLSLPPRDEEDLI